MMKKILLFGILIFGAPALRAQLPFLTDSTVIKFASENVSWIQRLDSLKAYINTGGNGIYSGSGTVPSGAIGIITDALNLQRSTATNSAVVTPVVIDGRVTGAGGGAAGFGTGLLFTAESATIENREIFGIEPSWTISTDATRTASIAFRLPSSGTYATRLTLTGSTLTAPGSFTFGNSSSDVALGGSSGRAVLSSSANAGDAILLLPTSSTTGSLNGITLLGSSTATNTSGARIGVTTSGAFAPTSGTATYSAQEITTTFNQTGGANGITRGLHINPTVTAAANFRALDIAHNVSNTHAIYQGGANVLNFINGNTGIGVAPGDNKLYVSGATRFDLGSDATGDMYYRNSSGAFTRLALGANGQVLSSTGTIPAWTTPSGGGATDLTFTGSASPYTLNSSTGTDVTIAAGANITLTRSSNELTIAATGGAVTDGDKGDIDVTASGATWTVDTGAVNNLKLSTGAGGLYKGNGSIANNTTATVLGYMNFQYNTGSGEAISIDNSTGQVRLTNGTNNGSILVQKDSTTIDTRKLKFTGDTIDISGVTTKIGFPSGGGGMTSWTLAGTSGTPQAVSDAQTATIAAGTGMITTAGATRTVTVSADTTLLATLNDLEIARDTALKAATHTAVINNIALMNCSAAARTVNPPESPVSGDWFAVSDARAASGTNNITIAFVTASQKLYGTVQNYILNTNGAYVKFIYVNANTGWIATKG